KALAHESGLNFISVQSANVLSRYLGESERALKEIFRIAKQAAPSIIYFDEIESLFPERHGSSSAFASTESRLTAQFLAEMRGIEELNGVTILAATNRVDLVDESLLSSGIFDLKLELPLPDFEARKEILNILLRKKPLSDDVKISELSQVTDGLSGGDISMIVRRAASIALKNDIENFVIRRGDFDEALRGLGK
ncbi:MAG: AAA family ATPase, partial [Synergistaceae bacterium]|nr:AAA family ATPase [Synergistaceae bacterium]